MRKFFAHFIAMFVPSRKARHLFRKILEFGLFRYLKVRRNQGGNFPYYLSICAIAKNEGPYIREWIEYHRLVGVEKFYIYDNGSDDDMRMILEPYMHGGIVDYVYWPGKTQQMPAYNHCLRKHMFDTRWLAFIDLDEFIVPMETETIPQFLKNFESESGLEIHWLVYGSGGAEKKASGLVMERFKDHSEPAWPTNGVVKSIINPRCVASWSHSSHIPSYWSGHGVNSDREHIASDFVTRIPVLDKIRINHYHCKSWQEYREIQMTRGDVFYTDAAPYRNREQFENLDRNDIQNDKKMDKYIEAVKRKIEM
jgi:hypothetical protein